MKEIEIIKYEAKDGKIFDTPDDCIRHEKILTENMKAKQKFNDLLDFCKKRVETEIDFSTTFCMNAECPFYYETYANNCLFGFILSNESKLEI